VPFAALGELMTTKQSVPIAEIVILRGDVYENGYAYQLQERKIRGRSKANLSNCILLADSTFERGCDKEILNNNDRSLNVFWNQ
jgi:hypothetical protein